MSILPRLVQLLLLLLPEMGSHVSSIAVAAATSVMFGDVHVHYDGDGDGGNADGDNECRGR